MPRRKGKDFSRSIVPDPVYGSELVHKLINIVMWRGKKNAARKIVYGALDQINKKVGGDKQKTLEYFTDSFEKIVPRVEVRPRRVGGSVYQIPTEVRSDRARALALRWLIRAAEGRTGKNMAIRLANELMDAHENRGGAIKKKTDVYRMAESNRAFSHYAW